MSKSYLFVILLATLLVEGCGGGNSTPTPPPPSPVATHFSVTVPSAASAGVAIQVTVTALSASNNSVANYSGTVHFTSSDSRAILPTDATLISGTGSVFVTLNTAAAQTVTATDTATATITGTSSAINVSPAQFNPVGSMSNPREFRRRRAQPVLAFDVTQKVPEHVLKSIIEDWLEVSMPLVLLEMAERGGLSYP
jgi:hypothetical protein